MAYVRQTGLPIPTQAPGPEPHWPANMADLVDQELSHQLGWYAAQVAYAGYQVALADVERTSYEAEVKVNSTRCFLQATGNVTERREAAKGNPAVIAAGERLDVHTARYKLLSAIFSGYEARYKALSRELTRRDQSLRRGT